MFSGRAHTPSRNSARRAAVNCSRSSERSAASRRSAMTTASTHRPRHVRFGARRLVACRACRSRRRAPVKSIVAVLGRQLACADHAGQGDACRALGDAEERSGANEDPSGENGRLGAEERAGDDRTSGELSRRCEITQLHHVFRNCNAWAVALTMLPPSDELPDVLPTERLLANGKPVPELRVELRRIPNLLNAWSVVALWLEHDRHHRRGDLDQPSAGVARRLRAHGAPVRRDSPASPTRPRTVCCSRTSASTTSSGAGCSAIRRSRRPTCTGAVTWPTTRTSSGRTNPT